MYRRLLKSIFFLCLSSQVFADEAKPEDFFKEDPFALFSVDVGDANVDFLLSGYWKSSISFGTSKGLSSFLPGYVSEPWQNSVDLLLSVIYDQSFFVETHVTEKIDESTFVLGYEQTGSYGLKKLVVGNDRIGIDLDYGALPFAKSVRGNPGLAFRWSEMDFDLEALMRVQSSNTVTESYRGGSSIDGYQRTVRDFALGYSFNLPHKNIGNLKVYVQASEGLSGSGGKSFKLLTASDFSSINLTEGEFSLKEEQRGLIAVSYDVSGTTWNLQTGTKVFPYLVSSSGKLDFSSTATFDLGGGSFYTNVSDNYRSFYSRSDPNGLGGISTTIGGTTCLIVHRDNEINPFENLSFYKSSVKNQKAVEFSVTLRGIVLLKQNSLSIDGYFRIPNQGNSNFAGQYPLYALSTNDATATYSPVEPLSTIAFLNTSELGTAVRKISLGGQPIPETIAVARNKITESNWIYDFDSNSIVLTIPAQTTDEIVISYEKQDRLGENKYFQFLTGLSTKIDEKSSFSNALFGTVSLTENLDKEYTANSDFSLQDQSKLILSDSIQTLSLEMLVGLQIPTLNEFQRISSFSETEYGLEINSSNLAPASLGPSPTFSNQSQRAALLYRNFKTLNGYLAYNSPSAPATSAYIDGNPVGPVVSSAAPTDPDLGQSAILTFSSSASENWIGASIVLNDGEKNLLKTANYIRFWIKGIALPVGTYNAYIVGGTFSEDTDGNGLSSTGSTDKGIPFVHRALNLYAQQDASDRVIVQAEDINQNKYLDAEGGLSNTLLSPGFSGGTSTQSYLVPLDDQMRTIISNGNKLGIYITVPSSVSGTFVWGGVKIGTGALVARDSTGAKLTTSVESASAGIAGSGAPSFKEGQEVNKNSQNSFTKVVLSSSNTNIIKKNVNSFSFYQVEKMFFFLAADSSIPNVVLRGLDQFGNESFRIGSFNLTGGSWYELFIDATKSTWEIRNFSGSVVQSGALSIDYSKTTSQIELDIPPLTASLYLDDLISSNSMVNGLYKAKTSYSLKLKDIGVSVEKFLIFADPGIDIKLNYDTSIPGRPYLAPNYDLDLGANLSFLLLDSELAFAIVYSSNNEAQAFKYSHALVAPSARFSPVNLTEEFGYQQMNRNNSSHGLTLSATGDGSAIKIGGETQINYLDLFQIYSLSLKSPQTLVGDFNYGLQVKNSIERAYRDQSIQEAYGANWQYLFLDSPPSSQSEDMLFGYAFKFGGFSLDSSVKLGFKYFSNASIDDQNYFSYNMGTRFPLDLITLKLDYENTFNRSFVNQDGINVSNQNSEVFARIFSEEFLSPIFVELYSPNVHPLLTSGLLKSQPSLKLLAENPTSLGIADFIVPKSVGAEIYTTDTSSPSGTSFQNYHVFSTKFQAINQFGISGITPLFDWYDTDSFQNIVRLFFDNETVGTTALSLDTRISLFGLDRQQNWAELSKNLSSIIELTEPWSLSLMNKYTYNFKVKDFFAEKITLGFSWGGLGPNDIDPRPTKLKSKLGLLTNEETLGFETGCPTGEFSPNQSMPLDLGVKTNQFNSNFGHLEIQHSTILAYPSFGYIKAYVKIGMFFVETKSEIEALLGFELKLSF